MERSRAITIGLGAFFIFMGLLVPAGLTFYEGTNEFEAFFYSICSFVVLVVLGTVILIVGIARSDRRIQQQQQQVVVMTAPGATPYVMAGGSAPAPSATGVRCSRCGAISLAQAKFCKQCGTHFGGGRR